MPYYISREDEGFMEFYLGIGLLAVSLSIDALGIGLSYGLRKIKIPILAKLIICFISMAFTETAILIGNVIKNFLPDIISKGIGSLMLLVLGIFIIVQAFIKKEKPPKPKSSSFSFKFLGVTVNIIRNPSSCDFDKSCDIDALEAIYLGTALSIDSFGAGVSSAVTGLNSILVPLTVGLFQILFLYFGNILGKKVSSFKKLDSKVFVVLSGSLMIILAAIRFLV